MINGQTSGSGSRNLVKSIPGIGGILSVDSQKSHPFGPRFKEKRSLFLLKQHGLMLVEPEKHDFLLVMESDILPAQVRCCPPTPPPSQQVGAASLQATLLPVVPGYLKHSPPILYERRHGGLSTAFLAVQVI